MKDTMAKGIFVFIDMLMITLAVYLAFTLRDSFGSFEEHHVGMYLTFSPLYIVILALFAYEGIYTYRYDFWHESKIIIKVLIFATILVFAYLAMTKSIEFYSRIVIGTSFLILTILIPLSKNILKRSLHQAGLWQKQAEIYGNDGFLVEEIYGNPYLGYIKPKKHSSKKLNTIFINSKDQNPDTLKEVLAEQIKKKDEVIFIPLMREYDLTHSHIYELSNTRTNLIVYKNRLTSRYRQWVQAIYNYILAILLLPFLLLIIGVIAIFIKSESPGPLFFRHNRIGKKGRTIPVFKFRSMYQDASQRLEKLLQEDAAIKEEWETNFKLKNDPRVTKVGNFLRKTSLDELPQIFNILRGDMHFVGPRPVVQDEIDKYYGSICEYYYMVKPGITGLWQVSGRSDTDYDFRIKTDKWYVLNWSMWLDIVILFKTIRVVIKREGAC